MQDTAAISRAARVVEQSDRPSASQLLDEAIAATRQLPDLHELHAVGAFPVSAAPRCLG